MKGLAAGRVAGAIPHSDAASQNALDGASVEGAHDGGPGLLALLSLWRSRDAVKIINIIKKIKMKKHTTGPCTLHSFVL